MILKNLFLLENKNKITCTCFEGNDLAGEKIKAA